MIHDLGLLKLYIWEMDKLLCKLLVTFVLVLIVIVKCSVLGGILWRLGFSKLLISVGSACCYLFGCWYLETEQRVDLGFRDRARTLVSVGGFPHKKKKKNPSGTNMIFWSSMLIFLSGKNILECRTKFAHEKLNKYRRVWRNIGKLQMNCTIRYQLDIFLLVSS